MKRFAIFMLAATLTILTALPCQAADKVYEIKLSVDSNMNHHRNIGLKVFQAFLERNGKGRIKLNYFHSAQLYKDKDIPKAMKLGTVDMAVPGIWQLEGVDPNMGITGLPLFFGLPEKVTKDLIDGEVGQILNESLEKKMGVKILGKWYYHGYLHSCAKTKPLHSLADFKGLKMRHMGGASSALRLEAMGASPVMIPWPDLPMAIVQGTADGFVTTFRSFMSAKLWETGAKYAVKDKEYYLHYVPMVSKRFWDSLPEDIQKIVLDTWEEHIDIARAISEYEQKRGEDVMEANGVEIYRPSDKELGEWRKEIMKVQDKVVAEVGMDPDLVVKVQQIVEKALQK